jgi:N-acetylneuraminic acid mutarotase
LFLDNASLNTAELYDPATGKWTPTGNLNHARISSSAAELPNGKVLIIGGWAGWHEPAPLNSAELYDPATGSWTLVNNLGNPESGQTESVLLNGKVLVAGGYNGNGNLKTAELY